MRHDAVDDASRAVGLEGGQVVGERHAVGLPWLGHEVRHADLQGGRRAQGVGDPPDQKVRDQARVERAGRQDDDVRMGDRLEHFRQRPGSAGSRNTRRMGSPARDARLAQDAAPIGQLGAEPYDVERRRQDGTPHGQHLAGDADRVEEIARDLGEGGEEEVTEAVARELTLAGEAELEELGHQRLDLGQRDETVPDVARREHLQLVAEPPGAAAVVGHGDDGRQRRHAAAEIALERRQDHR